MSLDPRHASKDWLINLIVSPANIDRVLSALSLTTILAFSIISILLIAAISFAVIGDILAPISEGLSKINIGILHAVGYL